MSASATESGGDPAEALLALYDRSLGHVYGYLLSRCGRVAVAQDLTGETFVAAVDAVRREPVAPLSTAWLIGVARHKLVDHWRRQEREERGLRLAAASGGGDDDLWEVRLERVRARAALDQLGAHHRAALVLRYVDDLPVRTVAEHLDRTVHATEALLVRARSAFRRIYDDEGESDA